MFLSLQALRQFLFMAERAVYVHGDGTEEEVSVIAHHPECEAFTVFVPSLGRERQTTQSKLKRFGAPESTPTTPVLRHSGSSVPPQPGSYAAPQSSLLATSTSGSSSDWPGVDASAPPAIYSYHRSLPQMADDPRSSTHVVSPWAAAAWTRGKSDGGYAEIVDGVYGGGGAVGIKPRTLEEEASMYAKMLRATAAFEKASEVSGRLEMPEPQVARGYHFAPEATTAREFVRNAVSSGPGLDVTGGDGVYKETKRPFFSVPSWQGYGAASYQSLGALPEDKAASDYLGDIDEASRPRRAADLICNPVSCCSVS